MYTAQQSQAGRALPAFWVSHRTQAVTWAQSRARSCGSLGSAADGSWPSLHRRPSALQLLCSQRGQGQGSPGFWPTRETPHPSWPVAEDLTTSLPLWKVVEAEDRQDFPTSELAWFSSLPLPLSPCPKRSCLTQLCHDPPPV